MLLCVILLALLAIVRRPNLASYLTLPAGMTDFLSHRSQPPLLPGHVTDIAGIQLVHIEPGIVNVGSPKDEPGHEPSELQRTVEITAAFAISVYEITHRQWYAVIDPDHVVPPDEQDFPITNITWHDAENFCHLLSTQTDRVFRLATESEWESACRGGMSGMFGINAEELGEACGRLKHGDPYALQRRAPSAFNVANLNGPTPVGTFASNRFGLYDMHGNVWEWCARSDDAPSLLDRPIRGGAWTSTNPLDCRSAKRAWQRADKRSPSIGFRVVMNL
jgi:formylglycine-generating enzyme required for sulfatase activity